MQLGYTTAFGWYATFLYLRTGHLIAPIMAHTFFCNTVRLHYFDKALTSLNKKVIGIAYIVEIILTNIGVNLAVFIHVFADNTSLERVRKF
ncbi:hypothetical protein R1sor_002080 [Riccia sorocarpa]|uniref:intramembrane prenyl-peptidase Rce1 n=1 Tax=Riccia sorocarpa TaxID=122646 RepID=A0ABD3GY57_9MARC